MKPIYEPKGKAKEYGDLAINIYKWRSNMNHSKISKSWVSKPPQSWCYVQDLEREG